MTEGTYTTALGEFMAASQSAELPSELTRHVNLVILDAIGCGFLGSRAPWNQIIRQTLTATETPGKSVLWGTSDRLSAANAAMFNGSAVHGYELDDVGPGSHMGSVTATVALSLAEDGSRLSGRDLVRSVVTGIEVASRVYACVGRMPHDGCGFHGPGLYGAFAAMGTASHALGLDPAQASSALGHVSQFTSGIMAVQHGGMGKRLLAGKAAHSGTLAAQLAKHGFTNAPTIFECGYGSWSSTFSGGRETYDLEALTAGLGTDYNSYKLRFKFFAARGPIHPALEIVEGLMRERQLRADEIERIDIAMPEGSFKAVGFPYEPTSVTSAQMNVQFCVATLLLEGDVFVEQFVDERLTEPALLDLVSRITVRHEPAFDEGPEIKPRDTRMEFTLKSGEVILREQDRYLVGYGEDPHLADRVATKFRRMTKSQLSVEEQDRAIELCGRLHELSDVTPIVELLARRDARP